MAVQGTGYRPTKIILLVNYYNLYAKQAHDIKITHEKGEGSNHIVSSVERQTITRPNVCLVQSFQRINSHWSGFIRWFAVGWCVQWTLVPFFCSFNYSTLVVVRQLLAFFSLFYSNSYIFYSQSMVVLHSPRSNTFSVHTVKCCK